MSTCDCPDCVGRKASIVSERIQSNTARMQEVYDLAELGEQRLRQALAKAWKVAAAHRTDKNAERNARMIDNLQTALQIAQRANRP